MQPEKKKVFGYKRVSTEEQVDGMSLQNQERAIRAYASAHNFEIVGFYSEEGVSAKTARRPKLQQMIADITVNGVTGIVVYNTSRISRNLESYSRDIGYHLAAKGVTLYSTQENIDDTPEGRLMKNITLSIHQYDNDLKSKVTRDNMELVAQEGWWQGKVPYGYVARRVPVGVKTRDGKVKARLTLDPDTRDGLSEKIRLFLERFSRGDMSQTDLIQYAKSIGLKSATGGDFAPQSINNMLTYSTYAGYIKNRLTGGELVKAKHNGLISLDTYQRNQALLHGTKPSAVAPRFNNEYPLKHTLLCSSCHKPMTGSAPRNGSGVRSPRYHCTRCTGTGSISAHEMERSFQALLEKVTPTEGTVRLFKAIVKRTAAKKLTHVNKEIGDLRLQLNKIDDDINKATQRYLDDDISKEEKENYQQSRVLHRIDMEHSLEKLEGVQRLNEGTIDYVCNFIDKPLKMWLDADMQTKVIFQQMIIPEGIEFDIKSRNFGTATISPLYRLETNKKDPSETKESLMVTLRGIEPLLPG